jgi:tetratricopeptide (TPR) repeat protein
LLLDRRKIRRWAKWVALVLAIIFAISFVAIGVGQGSGGANVFAALSCSNNTAASSQPKTTDEKIAAFQAALLTNPKDKDALLGLANVYQAVYDAGQSNGNAALVEEAKYLQQLIDADPTQIAVYLRLAKLYVSNLKDNKSAIVVLNKAADQAPDNADVFLQLGLAQRQAGNSPAAVMAWQRYLALAPNGDQASAIRAQIKILSETTTTAASTTTTTTGSSTTTTGSATSSTATTASPTTTTTK